MIGSLFRSNPSKVHSPVSLSITSFLNVELHVGHDAGGGEEADIHFKEPADGDFAAFVVEKIGAELTAAYQKHAKAVGTAVVDNGSLFDGFEINNLSDTVALLRGHLVPDGKIFCKFLNHGTYLLMLLLYHAG